MNKTYLAGGYIRDEMLGVPSHDRDYPQRQYLIGAIDALTSIDNKKLLKDVPQGKVVETLHRKRLSVLKDYINSVS